MSGMDWPRRAARMADEDLIEIVSAGDAGGFEPHVIAAARSELERRQPGADFVADVEVAVQDMQVSRRERATEPLSNAGWVAFILFGPVLIGTIAVVIIFFAIGQSQKGKDALGAIFWSFFLWAVLGAGLAFLLG
jgi:hypothetical protein